MVERLYRWTCRCGAEQAMPEETNRVLRHSNATFYCVHGHQSHYPEGESETDKLRRERGQLKQRIAYKDDMLRAAQARADHERHRANGYKGHATRITKRAKAGVCPCCNRTFQQLARHMASQHPEFTPIEVEQVPQGATVQ